MIRRRALRCDASPTKRRHAGTNGEGSPIMAHRRVGGDAGHCRLLRVLVLRASAGVVVEVYYCQALIDGKASPYHPLRLRLVLRRPLHRRPFVSGSEITITPLEPRGCRYIEVHAVHDDDGGATAEMISAAAASRPLAAGSFACESDPLLQAVWGKRAHDVRLRGTPDRWAVP